MSISWTPDFAKHLTLHISGTTESGGYSWNVCKKVINSKTGEVFTGKEAQSLNNKIQKAGIQKEQKIRPLLRAENPELEGKDNTNDDADFTIDENLELVVKFKGDLDSKKKAKFEAIATENKKFKG